MQFHLITVVTGDYYAPHGSGALSNAVILLLSVSFPWLNNGTF